MKKTKTRHMARVIIFIWFMWKCFQFFLCFECCERKYERRIENGNENMRLVSTSTDVIAMCTALRPCKHFKRGIIIAKFIMQQTKCTPAHFEINRKPSPNSFQTHSQTAPSIPSPHLILLSTENILKPGICRANNRRRRRIFSFHLSHYPVSFKVCFIVVTKLFALVNEKIFLAFGRVECEVEWSGETADNYFVPTIETRYRAAL